ncbi:MAG TPA: FAD-dependent oxidoreductase [Firmicutes bacterium]|nr:FAD-dependent oxidoreductase [Bacillota bacterium]
MKTVNHEVDFCVVGGGLAGICAAIAAARHNARVLLMQDRPVLGGNASSEIRMWVCGARGPNNREIGILEEIALENIYRNPMQNYSLWDSVLYEKVRFEPNITLLLNCACTDLRMDGNRIVSVRGYQTTTQTWHEVNAALFADCSGDSVLAPLSGAEFRVGREAASEFGEDIQPAEADRRTMGMSLLIQARETHKPQPFTPPSWAYVYESDADLPYRDHDLRKYVTNFWWIELGGEQDSIYDTEEIRDELLKVAFGVWDHIKNRGDHGAENWALDWVGFLPGKRESRRYVGDHIITQHDVRAGGPFEDIAAYGGWSMDDHHPGGMNWSGKPTIFHPSPSPFGIPYRALYSRNIENLFFAGRNISTTHAALSATRVMGTCAICGQAVGTAAAIATVHGLTPRQVYAQQLAELQQTLMDDDAWLPGLRRVMPVLTQEADLTASQDDPEVLRSGIDRPIGDVYNGWKGPLNATVQYTFAVPRRIEAARFIFDSNLNRRGHNQRASYPLDQEPIAVPASLVRAFRLEALDEVGQWHAVARVENNYQRLVRVKLHVTTTSLRFVPEATWGAETAHLFAFDVR